MLTAKAGAQCRVPVPSPPPRHGGRRGRWGQAAGEAYGGKRGWWGQARPMGAASHRPHARARQHRTLGKPPGQIPSQHVEPGNSVSQRQLLDSPLDSSGRSTLCICAVAFPSFI
jgi:hypothetical protein